MIRSLIFHAGRLDTFFFSNGIAHTSPIQNASGFPYVVFVHPASASAQHNPTRAKLARAPRLRETTGAKEERKRWISVIFGGTSAAYAIAEHRNKSSQPPFHRCVKLPREYNNEAWREGGRRAGEEPRFRCQRRMADPTC